MKRIVCICFCGLFVQWTIAQTAPKWIEKDAQNLTCRIVALPQRDDIDFEINEQLIVELYSK